MPAQLGRYSGLQASVVAAETAVRRRQDELRALQAQLNKQLSEAHY